MSLDNPDSLLTPPYNGGQKKDLWIEYQNDEGHVYYYNEQTGGK